MKKSTILIILVVFLGSVLIVGIFGMKAVPFESIVYCKSIVPTSVVTTTGKVLEIGKNDNGYFLVVHYEENLGLLINYNLDPADCTFKEVHTSIVYPEKNPPAVITDKGEIVFNRQGTVRIQFRATDSPTAPTMDFWIYAYDYVPEK